MSREIPPYDLYYGRTEELYKQGQALELQLALLRFTGKEYTAATAAITAVRMGLLLALGVLLTALLQRIYPLDFFLPYLIAAAFLYLNIEGLTVVYRFRVDRRTIEYLTKRNQELKDELERNLVMIEQLRLHTEKMRAEAEARNREREDKVT